MIRSFWRWLTVPRGRVPHRFHGVARGRRNERGIALVGDIPIYVADNSADVWSRPDLYELGEDGLPTVIAGEAESA